MLSQQGKKKYSCYQGSDVKILNTDKLFRAINFYTYGNGKKAYTELNNGKETPIVHLASAATAGNVKICWCN